LRGGVSWGDQNGREICTAWATHVRKLWAAIGRFPGEKKERGIDKGGGWRERGRTIFGDRGKQDSNGEEHAGVVRRENPLREKRVALAHVERGTSLEEKQKLQVGNRLV